MSSRTAYLQKELQDSEGSIEKLCLKTTKQKNTLGLSFKKIPYFVQKCFI